MSTCAHICLHSINRSLPNLLWLQMVKNQEQEIMSHRPNPGYLAPKFSKKNPICLAASSQPMMLWKTMLGFLFHTNWFQSTRRPFYIQQINLPSTPSNWGCGLVLFSWSWYHLPFQVKQTVQHTRPPEQVACLFLIPSDTIMIFVLNKPRHLALAGCRTQD